ncbi:MAG: diaminopimelate decarboxylase [Gammaproteobacteria bacterium]|nr:diaminopimelate decarboxylase [Gammaproteobacteria bacterium]|tara:strand:- start:6728 stop:7969 length:1242 start_codon:yes stop_codon:yes gene_type:complete
MSNFFYKDGVLFCEDVPVSDIALKYGTPSYVYSKKTLEDNFDAYSNSFIENEGMVCFSVKSLSNISILRLLSEKGSGFDIVSGGELERVIVAGADPKKIIFTGIAKTNAEIIQGIKKDILSFNIESESEMLRIERIAKKEKTIVDVTIRFNPEIDSGGHEYIKTGRKKDKFGILLDGVLKLSKYISSSDSLNLIGLSCHIGSQIFDLNDFKESAKYIKKLAREINNTGIELKFLDIGGGLGISYTESDFPFPGDLVKDIKKELNDRNEKIILEPGRSISGNAGIMLTSVEYIKGKYLIVDAGMNDLIRPALYGAKHDVINVKKGKSKANNWTIVGPICESSDVLAKDYLLEASEGDVLAVKTAGAYGHVMSSNYNSRRKPPEILVDGNKFKVIRKRESYDDLIKNEVNIESEF